MIRVFDGDLATSGVQFYNGTTLEVSKAIEYRLKIFLGEYFLNISEGTPWFQSILGKSDASRGSLAIKSRILSTANVRTLTDYSFTFEQRERRLTVSAGVVSDFGAFQFDFNEVII